MIKKRRRGDFATEPRSDDARRPPGVVAGTMKVPVRMLGVVTGSRRPYARRF